MDEHDDILLHSNVIVQPQPAIAATAHISTEEYKQKYAYSITEPEKFWAGVASEELEWFKKWDKVMQWDHPDYQWFLGAQLNITHNCLDRHLTNGNSHKTAFIYTNEDGDEQRLTYKELYTRVCRFANGLKSLGVTKGDRVAIYMALSLEQIVAMLACARIGAIHNVVYGGFSAHALKMRIEDAQARVLIASAYTRRRGKNIDLKHIAEEATHGLACVKHIIMDRLDADHAPQANELRFESLMDGQPDTCPAEVMDAEDPLFILYTSGTTGKPKGVLHTTAGYNVFTHYTTRISFDLKDDDIYWCTADTGWITGHSYIVYGPLSNGATSLIYEGAPDCPDPGIWWRVVEKYKVSKFYTAPTAVRLFMKYGEAYPDQYDLSSLKILGSVGEPINPEAWQWYYRVIGRNNCVVIDTWWQTETGGHMIVALPSLPQKPGKAGLPFFGVEADVVNSRGEAVPADTVGLLVIRKPWPSALRTCYGEPERFLKYWEEIKGFYFAGDLATKDKDGYITILGRSDDVLNVSGHRIGTAEVESALVSYAHIAEAAVIGKPHEIKGQSIKAFVILNKGVEESEGLLKEILKHVKEELGSIGMPDEVEIVDKLPKTRSGKIMRRVLKAKEMGMEAGDTSTLED